MKTYTKFKEYIWLVNTIHKARRITFAEIQEKWLQTKFKKKTELVPRFDTASIYICKLLLT